VFLQTEVFPNGLPAGGQCVDLAQSVWTNGILLTANNLRTDEFGRYAFQMAEVYGGNSSDYPRLSVAASSTTAADVTAAIDGSAETGWSSAGHPAANYYEWVAFWFETAQTNTLRMLPWAPVGGATCVPQSINIYYSNGSAWVYLKSVDLPANMPPAGYLVPLNTAEHPDGVWTNGLLLTTSALRADPAGVYAFRMAELTGAYVGSGAAMARYYHLDALGSVRVVTKGNGTEEAHHDFLPFGEEYNGSSTGLLLIERAAAPRTGGSSMLRGTSAERHRS
jgi:hypothetical protein